MMEIPLYVWFAGLMLLSVWIYISADGYDLGVGMLSIGLKGAVKKQAIESIGPFWDANETWLVLGVGLLMAAFPGGHGAVLGALYLPCALMLTGIVLRGVSYETYVKSSTSWRYKVWCERGFFLGSLLAASMQGVMCALWVSNFEYNWLLMSAGGVGLCTVYILLGMGWLGARKVITVGLGQWGAGVLGTVILLGVVSLLSLLSFEQVQERWLGQESPLWYWAIPVLVVGLGAGSVQCWRQQWHWRAFWCVQAMMLLGCIGLAIGTYPDLVIGSLSLQEAAASTETLRQIGWGVIVVLPCILLYSVWMHWVFLKPGRKNREQGSVELVYKGVVENEQ